MAQKFIGLGVASDDGNGDSLRVAGGKINDNFTELYAKYITTSPEVLIQGMMVNTSGNTDVLAIEVGNTFRGWLGNRYVVGKVLQVPINFATDIDEPTKIALVTDTNGDWYTWNGTSWVVTPLSVIRIFNNVQDMTAETFVAGQIVKTLGYYTPNDGGGNTYTIVIGSLLNDFGAIINITGNIYAVALDTSNLNNMHYGVFSDNSTNWSSTARYQKLKDASVKYGITLISPPNTYFNCELNLGSTHSGAKIHFDNAVFAGLLHFVGTSYSNSLKDCYFTGTLSTYDRFGTINTINILGGLNVICKNDPLINLNGTGGRGVHIYYGCENNVYGNFIIENNDTQGTNNVQAAFAIDGITNTNLGSFAPKNISINSIWVKDCKTRGVQITGYGHNIGSIRVDRFGSDTFDSAMPSMGITTYTGEIASQIAQGVLLLYTNAKIEHIEVHQLDGFVGRSRALTDLAIGRYTVDTNPINYTRLYPIIGSFVSTNPLRQSLSIGATQNSSGVSIQSIQIYEISPNNLLELNANGERAIYGLIDCYLATVNIGSIHCYNYKNATLLSQLDQSYSGTLKQQTFVNVGSISKEIISSTGKAYDIFQGAINYILIWGDVNNKSFFRI